MITKYVYIVFAALSVLATAIFAALNAGKSKEAAANAKRQADARVVNAETVANKQVETIKGANDVKNEVNKLDAGNAADKLRNEWQRD